MPIYEYVCRQCNEEFETLVRGGERPRCPACGTHRLEKRLSVFAAGSSSGKEPQPGACRSCGDPRGPGSCAFD